MEEEEVEEEHLRRKYGEKKWELIELEAKMKWWVRISRLSLSSLLVLSRLTWFFLESLSLIWGLKLRNSFSRKVAELYEGV